MTTTDVRRTVLDAARDLTPELSVRAAEGEALRTMPPDLVEKVRDAGLFGLALPRTLGGLEIEPLAFVDVIEELSRADGSAGWTVLIGNSTSFFAWLDPDVAREMIGDDVRFASTSMFGPLGRAVPDGSGAFTVSGRWPFNSGCPHAGWLQAGVFVTDGDGPRMLPDRGPDWRLAFFRPGDARILDTWDAVGLRGTGSHDLTVSELRVPQEHVAAPFFEPARHDGPLWRIPFFTQLAIYILGFPLGVARRALDEFTALAATKQRRGPGGDRRRDRGRAGRPGAGRGRCALRAGLRPRRHRRRLGHRARRGRPHDGATRARPARGAAGAPRRYRGRRRGVSAGRRVGGVLVRAVAALLPRHPHRGPAHLLQPGGVEALRPAAPGHRAVDLHDLGGTEGAVRGRIRQLPPRRRHPPGLNTDHTPVRDPEATMLSTTTLEAIRRDGSTRIPGDAPRIEPHDLSRVRAAAHHAHRVIPGVLGELVARELTAYADFGHRFHEDSLVPRLVRQVLAMTAPTDPPYPRTRDEGRGTRDEGRSAISAGDTRISAP